MTTAAVLRSEWIKIKTLRGTAWSLLAIFLLTAGFAIAANAATGDSETNNAGFDPLFSVFLGLNLGQIAAITFGTMAMSSEYQGGAIRASLTAVPNRSLFYAAKLATVAALTLTTGLLTTVVSFLGASAFLGNAAPNPTDPETLRACLGGALYLTLMALLAAGLTAALRSGLTVLSILIPFILIVSMVLGETTGSIADYLPDRAGQQVLYTNPPSNLTPLTGLAVTTLWTTTALITGWWTLKKRDT